MKASDLVRQLKEITDIHGDVRVLVGVRPPSLIGGDFPELQWVDCSLELGCAPHTTLRAHIPVAKIEPDIKRKEIHAIAVEQKWWKKGIH